jgi:transcription elongation factor Elf1
MQEGGASAIGKSGTDIYFNCSQCSAPLVVDRAAAGMTLNCQRCGKPTVVPSNTSSASDKEVIADLQRQLRENESQRTEITNYINQLTIQLHRWQHRLKMLNERNSQLLTDIHEPSSTPPNKNA